MSTSSTPRPPASRKPRASWVLPAWIGAAFALGLLLFWLLVLRGREDAALFTVQPDPDAGSARVFQPLPAPTPGSGSVADSASVMPEGEAQVVEPVAPPPPDSAAQPPLPPTMSAPPSMPPAHSPAPVASRDTAPRPVHSPQPAYPRQALRNRETGIVRLRVDVTAQGRVANVAVTSGSGSRTLDRAAMSAVRNWRFEPAMRHGQAVMGTVDVPIEFVLD